MASEEHKKLAEFVKNVHHMLRSQAQKIGADDAWKEHCSKTDLLKEYSHAMQKLASEFWEQNVKDDKRGVKCRIRWVIEKCSHYFLEGEMKKRRTKEEEKISKFKKEGKHLEEIGEVCIESVRDVIGNETEFPVPFLTLLDVGSCYNPFKVCPFFNVFPVDLAPAASDVYCCDFLNLRVTEAEECKKLSDVSSDCPITELPYSTFDVVVFSLLLEYLPSPKQRYECVCKAYNLLKSQGLLFIITPDSKHSAANAPLMKSWRLVIAGIGFSRVYYEKLPHVHCMAFRKDVNPAFSKHWADNILSKRESKLCKQVQINSLGLYIPQDFQEVVSDSCVLKEAEIERTSEDNELLVQMFAQLPHDNY